MAINEEQEDQPKGRKILPLTVPPGTIQGVSSAVRTQNRAEEADESVAGAATRGFADGFVHGANTQLGVAQQHRGADAPRETTAGHSAPVRNADGMSLADLTAPAPGEDPLPGMSQPLALDALDAIQGIPPGRTAAVAAKGAARSVVMDPQHIAGLQALESRQDDGLESGGSHYGR